MNPARIDRALSILGYLAQHPEGCTLKSLCDGLSLPMSSAHDLLQALVELDAVSLLGQRTYTLGPRSVVLALSIVDSVDLRHVSRPYLADLCGEINENTYLAVRSGNTVMYADRHEAGQTLSVVIKLGGSRPLHSSAVGKLMAAYNPELEQRVLQASQLERFTPHTLVNRDALREEFERVRACGYSVSDGESVEGIVGLATPIVDAAGAVTAAVHVSAPRGRLSHDRLPFVVAAMSHAGAEISRQLGAAQDRIPLRTIDEVRVFEQHRNSSSRQTE
ncbi:IclR family transcriptional regulator [Streptomyces albiflavescens]|uniref:IclR family transcriptional regulator n=1 Tax=Streptomyces albiflavescens TaxID=1623582 RepID=A0A917Y091_9ACTN|nr:IclR family transcriptional regulator [Streptomyces albiflavescens]GGN62073.1 IclR family transcriptional regulator [Streptomyces albiflavescens]